MAQFGWIEFSASDRQKFASALDQLKPEGMVDELGLGTLRDGIANQLFPGMSTIHTRAKYFFIVPYILHDYEQLLKNGKAKKNAIKYLEDEEYEIMWQLQEKYSEVENSGVIGILRKRPKKIVRRPSMIYWNGINIYGFMQTGGLSAPVFLQKATNHELASLLADILAGDDHTDDADADYENIFRVKFKPSKNWRQDLSIELSHAEAEFFYDQVRSIGKGRMIARLLTDDKLWQIFTASDNFGIFAKEAVRVLEEGELKKQLTIAHDFSELMYGAHITYNHLLQKAKFNKSNYEEDFDEWLYSLRHEMIDFEGFDVSTLISYNPHTRKTTQKFLHSWWELVNETSIDRVRRDELVESQEFDVKKSKSRLRYKKLDDVREEGWIGLTFLQYRNRVVKTILSDIKRGLEVNDTP
jgi:hypothetical protein